MKAIVYHKYGTPDVLEFTPIKPILRSSGLKETFRMTMKC